MNELETIIEEAFDRRAEITPRNVDASLKEAVTQVIGDEAHVVENRRLYAQKFFEAIALLSDVTTVQMPDAGFYLWIKTPISDTEFTKRLYQDYNVTVLPGSYLARDAHGKNPGKNFVRIALVASPQECIEAMSRMKTFLKSL